MDVQNISGTDIITSELSENTRISNETTNTENTTGTETEKIPEENKGNNIDTTA